MNKEFLIIITIFILINVISSILKAGQGKKSGRHKKSPTEPWIPPAPEKQTPEEKTFIDRGEINKPVAILEELFERITKPPVPPPLPPREAPVKKPEVPRTTLQSPPKTPALKEIPKPGKTAPSLPFRKSLTPWQRAVILHEILQPPRSRRKKRRA